MRLFSRLRSKQTQSSTKSDQVQSSAPVKATTEDDGQTRTLIQMLRETQSKEPNLSSKHDATSAPVRPVDTVLHSSNLSTDRKSRHTAKADQWDEGGDLDESDDLPKKGRIFRRRANSITTAGTSLPSDAVKKSKAVRSSLIPVEATDYSGVHSDDVVASSSKIDAIPSQGSNASLFRSTSRSRAMTDASSSRIPRPAMPNPQQLPPRRLSTSKDMTSPAMSISSPIGIDVATRPVIRSSISGGITTNTSASMSTKPPVRRNKSTKTTKRPATASTSPSITMESYISQLSPPPQGLPIALFDARKNLVTTYVQYTANQDVKALITETERALSLDTMRAPSHRDYDLVMRKVEEALYQSMQDALDQGVAAARYRDTRLADVFIEARRDLGLEPMSNRLHELFDLLEVKDVINTTLAPTLSSVPSSIGSSMWDSSSAKGPPSLSPAPRRRRPRTAPMEHIDKAGTFQSRASKSPGELHTPPSSSCNTTSSLAELSASGNGRPDVNRISDLIQSSNDREESRNTLLSRGSTNRISYITPSSLPPSPPRSIESHTSSKATLVDDHTLYRASRKGARAPSSRRKPVETSQDVTFEIMPDHPETYQIM